MPNDPIDFKVRLKVVDGQWQVSIRFTGKEVYKSMVTKGPQGTEVVRRVTEALFAEFIVEHTKGV